MPATTTPPTGLRLFARSVRHAVRNRRIGTFIVSFPKTGRTWLRMMIGRALIERYGVNEAFLLDTFRCTKAAGLAPARFSHGGPFHLLDEASFDQLSFDRKLYGRKRVLYLVRDVRDTLVSFYFQQARREKVYDGDIHEFVRDERYGARKLVSFYAMWFRNSAEPRDFLVFRYEQMRRDPVSVLCNALTFLGARDVRDAARKAVDYASFENMKRMESRGSFDRKLMKPGDPTDGESFKVRKGKIGGFVDYLSADDLAYIDETVRTLGHPTCDWFFDAGADPV